MLLKILDHEVELFVLSQAASRAVVNLSGDGDNLSSKVNKLHNISGETCRR